MSLDVLMNAHDNPSSLSFVSFLFCMLFMCLNMCTFFSGKRSQQGEKPGRVNGHEIHFFTPVRRSMRIEKTASSYPASLQEHDPCVTSMQDLMREQSKDAVAEDAPDSPLYVYRENEALKEHVQVQLLYEEVGVE